MGVGVGRVGRGRVRVGAVVGFGVRVDHRQPFDKVCVAREGCALVVLQPAQLRDEQLEDLVRVRVRVRVRGEG